MGLFRSRKFQVGLVLLSLLISFHILATHMKGDRKTSVVGRGAFEISSHIQRGIRFIKDKFSYIWRSYIDLINVKRENEKLRRDNKMLKMELQRLHEIYIEHGKLRKQLKFARSLPEHFLSASVVGGEIISNLRTITIDRGEKDGIKAKFPIMTPEGVVGRIIQVSHSFSQVLLITDYNSAVDVLVQRTRTRGILKGKYDKCYIDYLNRTEDIKVGDTVVTSGRDGIYPKGFFVGTIEKVSKLNYGLFQQVEVKPGVDFSKLENVMILLNRFSNKVTPQKVTQESCP